MAGVVKNGPMTMSDPAIFTRRLRTVHHKKSEVKQVVDLWRMLRQNAFDVVDVSLSGFFDETGRTHRGVLDAHQQLHQVQEVSQRICDDARRNAPWKRWTHVADLVSRIKT